MATWLWLVLCLACHMLACASLTSTSPLSKSALCPRSCCECSLPRSLCTSRSWQQVVRPCFRSILILFFSIVTYKSQQPNFFTIFQRQSRFGRRSSWQVICHVCAARDKHSQQRKWRAHPAAPGGGASGTASGVLNEFRAQLQNLQGNQS